MKLEFSAGGIVVKKDADGVFVLVSQHSAHHGWVFPKGRIGDHIENESKEDTAVREVEEETGARGKIIKELTPLIYFYDWEGEKIKKTVYYYLMNYLDGDITIHDFEMENVEWIAVSKVASRLTYDSDKKAWWEAKKLIENSI